MWLLVRDGRARRWRVHVTSYVADGYVYGLAVAVSHGQRETPASRAMQEMER